MEQLENVYGGMVEEGMLSRGLAGTKATGQAAGQWVKGVGRALIGRSNPISARAYKLYYKIANLTRSFASDINTISGGDTFDDEVFVVMESLRAISRGTGPLAESANEILIVIERRRGRAARPRKIRDLNALIG